jgi:hypothetical protein
LAILAGMAQPSTATATSLKVQQPNETRTLGHKANGSHRRPLIHPKFMGALNKIFNNETVDLVHF